MHSETEGDRPVAGTSQVVVRAGKYFACSSCGVMVELPEEVVGQLVLALNPSSQEPPKLETVEQQESASVEAAATVPTQAARPSNAVAVQPASPASSVRPQRPPRPRRPRTPARESFAGQIIDGLRVPTGGQLDRALAWVSFHLRVLDRQSGELNRLQKLLKQQRVAGPQPRGDAKEDMPQEPVHSARGTQPQHAQADLGVAPNRDIQTQRGPPQRRGPP
ncbi:hypothetical protein [Bremerella sp.]|uniref:hypothetical protein n=1 Tax=Bremerella sp. TaxID=2795602 RepID=UPI003918F90B